MTGDVPDEGFWARAARLPGGRIDVFLASFRSDRDTARSVDVELQGACPDPMAELGRLDPSSPDLRTYRPVEVIGGDSIRIELPSQSAAFLRVRCDRASSEPDATAPSTPQSGADELPATGGSPLLPTLVLLLPGAAGMALARRARRRSLSGGGA